ncbi:signal transduction histidine kinase [Catenulispora sp. GP43]|uniref:sensor histidine kinase n=1 Tax=Catenulispora sp. GP43 TaxID=3156263 RepID=UPI00351816BF
MQVGQDLIASIREEIDRLHRGRTDLAGQSEDVTSRLRPRFTHAGLELRHCTSGRADADVDPHRVTQILVNLLRNALAATPSGGTVTVTTSRAGPSGS